MATIWYKRNARGKSVYTKVALPAGNTNEERHDAAIAAVTAALSDAEIASALAESREPRLNWQLGVNATATAEDYALNQIGVCVALNGTRPEGWPSLAHDEALVQGVYDGMAP